MRRLIWIPMVLLLFPLSDSFGQGTDRITECSCVAFRLDDIQDYYLSQAQMEIISTFEARDTYLTIGVIGNHIGDDPTLVQFLKDRLDSDRFELDIANHGWNHEDFALLTLQEQSDLLEMSNAKISEHLEVQPTTFITPFNRMNEDTIAAMLENDLRVVSANVTGSYTPFVRNATDGALVYHFPTTAKTGDLNSDDTQWLGFGHEQTMTEINDSIGRYGYAVVMMHPQEFAARNGLEFQNAPDEDQLRELELLLDSVHAEGHQVVTLSELSRTAIVPEFPVQVLVAAGSLALLWFLGSYKRLVAGFWH